MSVHHVNSQSTENVIEAFAAFIEEVVRDQIENRRAEEGLMDDMWDESIKLRTRQHQMLNNRGVDNSTKTSTSNARGAARTAS